MAIAADNLDAALAFYDDIDRVLGLVALKGGRSKNKFSLFLDAIFIDQSACKATALAKRQADPRKARFC